MIDMISKKVKYLSKISNILIKVKSIFFGLIKFFCKISIIFKEIVKVYLI